MSIEPRDDEAMEFRELNLPERREAGGGNANGAGTKRAFQGPIMDAIGDLEVEVHVRVGSTTLSVKELDELRSGQVLDLGQDTREPVSVVVQGRVVATGYLVAVGDAFGVRIETVASP